VIYVMTHDSIGLGEDGPTHQPIEHLQSLRAMPQLDVYRPADAVETAECWALALQSDGPSILALTRQNLQPVRTEASGENRCARGAYRLKAAGNARKVIILATGSEVEIALAAAEKLEAQGVGTDVVSMPCTERFDAQPAAYREDILPDVSTARSCACRSRRGRPSAGNATRASRPRIGIDRFGVSAPAKDAYDYFGSPRQGRRSASRLHEDKRNPMTKVAINGFGRIGRLVARAILERPDCGLELVSVNDLADAKANAWLFKHDSVHGKFPGRGDDRRQRHRRRRQAHPGDCREGPGNLPHAANGVELALECTGFFTDRASAEKHIAAGAKKVLISAPAKGVDLTVVYGVNDDKLTAEHKIVSNASCTTNCLAPVAKVLNDALGIERGLMTTVHAYTNDQKILDQIHSDLRRARAAAMSMIPTTTGAARAVGEVLPELKGKLDGSAIRVPVPDVSLIDLTFTPGRDTTRDEVNQILKAASETGAPEGHLDYTGRAGRLDRPHAHAASSTVDSLETCGARASWSRRKLVRQRWGFSNAWSIPAGGDGEAGLS
jgi:glyceraldehyde 3-phosphate dehydrogenase